MQKGSRRFQIVFFCGRKGEDIYHVFWECKVSKSKWEASKFVNLPTRPPHQNSTLFLRDWQERLGWSEFEEVIVLLWGIWNQRDGKAFNPSGADLHGDLAEWASSYIRAYRAANSNPPQIRQTSEIRWHPPSYGVYKINTDASFSSSNSNAGLGIIIRNYRGQIMATATKYLQNVMSVDEAEALAAVEGLRVAMESGIYPVELEMDSIRIFKLFNKEMEDISEIGEIISDARDSVAPFLQASFKFTKREGNEAAHLLARRALLHHEQLILLEDWPNSTLCFRWSVWIA